MALFVPDISHHQAGISVARMKDEGAAGLIARVGQGAGRRRDGKTYGTTRDTEWARHRDEARRVGLPLMAYWYVGNLITPADNAALASAWVGDRSIRWMIDHEDASGDIAFYRSVVAAFRARGLDVALGYVPHWYYVSVGGGDLSGPPLVNSAYPGGSGTAAEIYGDGSRHARNWAGYGGNVVALLQFTNQAQYAGYRVDCSAFEGTPAELLAIFNGAPPSPAESPPTPREDEDVTVVTCSTPNHAGLLLEGGRFVDITEDPEARKWAQEHVDAKNWRELRVNEATWHGLLGTAPGTET